MIWAFNFSVFFTITVYLIGDCELSQQEYSNVEHLTLATVDLQTDKTEHKGDEIEEADEASTPESNGSSEQNDPFEPGLQISVKVLQGERDAISITDMADTGRLPELLVNHHMNTYSVDYHYNHSYIFYTAENKLSRGTLVGKGPLFDTKDIVKELVDGPVSLAVDWIHDRVYWMVHKYSTIEMANLDGTDRRTLFDNYKNFTYPNNIVVDPYEGYIFFVNNYAIYKSDLFGENVTILRIDGNIPGEKGYGVKCIALDRTNKKLYFSGRNHIHLTKKLYLSRSNYNGTKRENFNLTNLNDIYSMDVLGDSLYFAHFRDSAYKKGEECMDQVMSVSTKYLKKWSPRKRFVPRRCQSLIWSIKVYHPCAQKPGTDYYCSRSYL